MTVKFGMSSSLSIGVKKSIKCVKTVKFLHAI